MSDATDDVISGIIDVPQSEARLLLEAGYLYMELGKPKEAEEVFTGVAGLLPHSDVPKTALGNLHFSQGRYQRALKFHQEALKASPESAAAQAHIGEALIFLKKVPEANAALDKAAKMNPDDATASFIAALRSSMESGELPPQ